MITDCNLYSQTYVLKNNIYKWLPTEKHPACHLFALVFHVNDMNSCIQYPDIFIVRAFLI